MNSLIIEKSLGHISVQDLGRFTAQHLGFSASGVADEYAYLSGNQQLKNADNAAALEITFGQVDININGQCTIILTGANCQATVNNIEVAHWQILQLKSGDKLSLNKPIAGIYTYLCVYGGIQTSRQLNSRSELPKNLQTSFEQTIHLHKEFPLSDIANIETSPLSDTLKSPFSPALFYATQHLVLRFIPHQLWQTFDIKKQKMLSNQHYTLLASSNKMGYRFKGEAIMLNSQTNTSTYKQQKAQLSKPVTYGAIQLPDSGQPIVLMKDRQTIGGYQTLGTVIQTDLFRLAQMRANQTVSFLPIKLEQAQAQLAAFYQRFA